jgi:hypothetical protein
MVFMIKLENDNESHKAIVNAEIENWKQLRDAYKARVKEQRSMVRDRFYAKWYGVLMNLLLSFFMFRFLLYYYSLIQRKGLPQKSTNEVYFAINTSAKIFRWIAMFSVIVGIITLLFNMLKLVFSSSMSSSLPFIGISIGSFMYRALTPVIITITTIIATWVTVLIAEHLCLISNLCHISFLKVYGEEILDQQAVTPGEDSPIDDE